MLTYPIKFDILNMFTGRGIFYVNNSMALTGGNLAKALFREHTSECHFLLERKMKICRICNNPRPEKDFNKDDKAKDGLDGRCSKCYKEYRRVEKLWKKSGIMEDLNPHQP